MFHYFHDMGLKKNKYAITTVNDAVYIYETTIDGAIYVFNSMNSDYIEVEDFVGDKVAIATKYIVSIEKSEDK